MRKLVLCALGLALLAPDPASAEFRFQPNAATLSIGPAMLEDGAGTTFFLAGRVDLGTFHERVVWDAGLHWWQKTESSTFSFFGENSTIEARYRDLALTSGVKFLFPVQSPRWVPYARGGLGLNFVDASVESSGALAVPEVSDSDTNFGMYLGGGTSYQFSPSFLLGAEGVFNITDANHFLLGLTASFPFGSGRSVSE